MRTSRLPGGWKHRILSLAIMFVWLLQAAPQGFCAGDIDAVVKAGKLRHLGIPYANFVKRDNTGLDVELMQAFSEYLGVAYELVITDWEHIISDLTGSVVTPSGEDVVVEGDAPVRGDVIAAGFTVLPWREKVMDFSEPTFPSGVWLIARSEAPITPISPAGNIEKDIMAVKRRMKGISVLTLKDSCLAPELYGLNETGADIRMFPLDKDLDEMIPSVVARMAEATLSDVPVALIGLSTWAGKVKVIGPVSEPQEMAAGFRKESPKLRRAFAEFFRAFKASGRYRMLVSKYYPSVFIYYPSFFD